MNEAEIALEKFLSSLTKPPFNLSQEHADYVLAHWIWLRVVCGQQLPIPQMEPGEDNSLRFVWSHDAYYAEVEVHADGTHECFFRNRKTDSHVGSEGPVQGVPTAAFCDLLFGALQDESLENVATTG